MSQVIGKGPCPKCREDGRDKSGDNLISYDNGGKFCFACNYTVASKDKKGRKLTDAELGYEEDVKVDPSEFITRKQLKAIKEITSPSGRYNDKPIRGITQETNEYFFVRYEYDQEDGTPTKQYYPVTYKGKPAGYKIRKFPKDFSETKGKNSSNMDMFGQMQTEVHGRGKYCIITGGEIDAMTVHQVMVWNAKKKGYDNTWWDVVSPTIGENCKTQIKRNYRFFEQYERIYLALDNDDAGKNATINAIPALPRGKVYLVNWTDKDPNNMLLSGNHKQIIQDIWSAVRYAPRGLIGSGQLYDKMLARAEVDKMPLPKFMYQLEDLLAGGIPLGEIVNIAGASGSGKCLGIDTPILMSDGSVKKVQDVQVGDQLMGDDGSPRNVLSTCTGREPLYKVKQVKGMDYVVNESHILSLRAGMKRYGWEKGDIVDIPVKDYLSGSKFKRNILKGYRGHCLEMNNGASPWEPYMVGLWLADGTASKPQITFNKLDVELIDELHSFCDRNDYRTNISPSCDKENMVTVDIAGGMLAKLRDTVGVLNNKHIPDEYLFASVEVRRQVLAGILDGDGHKSGNCCVDFIQKKGKFVEQVIFLCRSLGLFVTTTDKFCKCQDFEGAYYTRLSISGHLNEIPFKIERKKHGVRCQEKQVGSTGITLEPLGEGDYYGFEIDGNRRFMLSDFTVTHNTSIANELIYFWIFNSPHYMGIVSMELDSGQYCEVISSRHLGRKIALIKDKEEKLSYLKDEDTKKQINHLLYDDKHNDRFMLVDDRDGTIEDMMKKVEELVISYGCKIVVLDPIQDILDGMSNEAQAEFLRWQKQMVASHVITFVNINHVRKSHGGAKQNSAGADLTEEDIQGSSTLFKSGSVNIMIMRNKYAEHIVDKNTTRVRISKCRWSGNTGDAGEWFYENETHTMYDKTYYFTEVNPAAWEAYQQYLQEAAEADA